MTGYCILPGCHKRAAGYSRLCETHRTRQRRHGAPDQRTITKLDLKPFVQEVEAWMARNPGNMTWSSAEQRLSALLTGGSRVAQASMHGPTKRAALELQRVGVAAEGRTIVVIVLALYLMKEVNPSAFRSERAFRLALARRVRSVSPLSFPRRNGADGRKRIASRELAPREAEAFASLLISALGPIGVYIAGRRAAAELRASEEKQKIQQYMNDLEFQ